MYTQLTSLKKDTNESLAGYVIRTATILTVLRNAGQTVDDALIIAMILKDLARHFDFFSIYITHSNKELTFSEFKTELHSFEKTLKHKDHSSCDDVMKLTFSFSKAKKNETSEVLQVVERDT